MMIEGQRYFNELLNMGSYDFVTADKFGKMVSPFFGPFS